MSYIIHFQDQSVDPISKAPITVNPGTVDTSTSLNLTGKGAPNYGTLQQENIVHLLEHFASPTPPSNPTIGQIWFDTTANTLKVLIAKVPGDIWRSVGGTQVTDVGANPPSPAALGDIWYSRTGGTSGVLYVFTGLGRYPQTGNTIGGWEQIYPQIDVIAGREEYDMLREMLEQLIGQGVSSYGSGAIGRSIVDLTNFGALDNDLRSKYKTITSPSGDSNILISTAGDLEITKQAISDTLFIHADFAIDVVAGLGNNPNEATISGSPADPTLAGSILINGVSTTVPAGTLVSSFQEDDMYIMWDKNNELPTTAIFYVVKRLDDGSWVHEGDANNWTTFVPTANMHIIGTFSSFVQDTNNTVFPGVKSGIMWAHGVPMVGTKIEHLKVEPNSNDWDQLLAAAKYAINRLEVPSNFINSISSVPFVNDRFQAPASLTSLSPSDVRYPSALRRSNRKVGLATQVQNFTETVNALGTAVANRFSLRGINGATGTNQNLAASTSIVPHASITPAYTGNTTTKQVQLRFANRDELYRWFGAGQGIQLEITHTGGSLAGDTNLTNLLSQVGVQRITADKTRIFGQSLPLTMSRATINKGIWNANPAGITLSSVIVGSAQLTVAISRVGNFDFAIQITINAGAALNGTTTIALNQIRDTETYLPGPQNVYPSLQPFQPSDILI